MGGPPSTVPCRARGRGGPSTVPVLLPAVTAGHCGRAVPACWRLTVQGIVQGVGFRPFVYRLAKALRLSGTVANTGLGVVIEVEGPLPDLDAFVHTLRDDPPPRARITSVHREALAAPLGRSDFVIIESLTGGARTANVAPDMATCPLCLREVTDPQDRRFRHPFTNCTACGPRYSILEAVPYDRRVTSMRVFAMCPECSKEYHDVRDRRFHAEPNACPACGPRLRLHDARGHLVEAQDPLAEVARALRNGAVVAVRGVGGFHLAVDATSEQAVERLRRRKRRASKPFAVMVKDLAAARALARVSTEEADLLASCERPIVLLVRSEAGWLAPKVAPGVRDVGVMLPYTPLHHLLLAQVATPQALVMTSGNAAGEPICTGNAEALERLSGIADLFLLHDREVVTRVDDSVARVVRGRTRLVRRARGYAPRPVCVPWALPPILACGAALKNTFCLARGRETFLSQHIGDLDDPRALTWFEEAVAHLSALLDITPERAAHDLHPDCPGARYAFTRPWPRAAVQHHHAHAVAVMAEHGLSGPVLAVVLDGSGYGPDGSVWGGEVLLAGRDRFRRLAHLQRAPLPGGDRAALETWRTGLAAMWATLGPDGIEEAVLPPGLRAVPAGSRRVVGEMMARGVNCPPSSSCGRLFDAVAALLGLRQGVEFEGQAAMELETLAWGARLEGKGPPAGKGGRWCQEVGLQRGGAPWTIEIGGPVRGVLEDLRLGVPAAVTAYRFHAWLVRTLTALCHRLSAETGVKTVVLGGGCLQNVLLLAGLMECLTEAGLAVYAGEEVPANDGGLSLGQAVVGGHVRQGLDA